MFLLIKFGSNPKFKNRVEKANQYKIKKKKRKKKKLINTFSLLVKKNYKNLSFLHNNRSLVFDKLKSHLSTLWLSVKKHYSYELPTMSWKTSKATLQCSMARKLREDATESGNLSCFLSLLLPKASERYVIDSHLRGVRPNHVSFVPDKICM